ncbi:MAG: proprotein convertase P-domain-containing protein, partial [Rickettsiales bacterium]|nr:proprotein convertase P-domain-containing protein [Rickettsiales bacterium]
FADNFNAGLSQTGSAIANLAATGRGGLGTNVVFSAGNSRSSGDNTNYHNMTNSEYIITVGGTDEGGEMAYFSTPGDSILVSAPAVNIATADRVGNNGYVSGDYVSASGTSYSAPIVSGVIALMLEANPGLGYRDVQEILAVSARKTGSGAWQTNGDSHWNGGGMHFSHELGFGLVDAHAAVRLAETWQNVSTAANRVVVDGGTSAPNSAIPDNQPTGVTDTINVSSDIHIDRVEVTLDIDHNWMGDLRVTLVSPDGTESVLVNRPGRDPDASSGYGSSADDIHFTMTSSAFWGETGDGGWTLRVSDLDGGITGRLLSWGIRLIGDTATANDTYLYTDEYAVYAGQPGRGLLSDTGGEDVINASALTGDAVLSLVPGATSTLAGAELALDSETLIEHAWLGDGDDLIIGNDADNSLHGMRGDDTLQGSAGHDTLDGGQGSDTADYNTETGRLIVNLFTQNVQLNWQNKDSLHSIENIIGGSGADQLYGDHGANVLRGMGGNDTISGFNGADTLDGGDGFDILSYSLSGKGVMVNLFAQTAQWDLQAQGDVISGFEGAVGGSGNDKLFGNHEANLLRGLGGNDTISGFNGADTLDGGAGHDMLLYWLAGSSVQVNLEANTASGDQAQGDVISGFEDVTGGNGHDVLTGSHENNLLIGGGGNDTLTGGTGADTLTGNSGEDYFVYTSLADSTDSATDLITDFVQGQDVLVLTGLGFTGVSAGVASGSVLGYSSGGGQTILSDDGSFQLVLSGTVALTDSDFQFA